MDKPSSVPKKLLPKGLKTILESTPKKPGGLFDAFSAKNLFSPTAWHTVASPSSPQLIAVPTKYTNGAPKDVTVEVDHFSNQLYIHTPSGWSESYSYDVIYNGWSTPVGVLHTSADVQKALPALLDCMLDNVLDAMVLTPTVHHGNRDLHIQVKFLGMEFSLRLKYDGLLKGWPIGDYGQPWGLGNQGEFGFLPDEYIQFNGWELSQHTGVRNWVRKKIQEMGFSLSHPVGTKYQSPSTSVLDVVTLKPKLKGYQTIGVDFAADFSVFGEKMLSAKKATEDFNAALMDAVQATDSIKLPVGLESNLTFEKEDIMLKMKAAVETVPQEIAKAAKADGMSETESLVVELVDLQRRIDAVGAEQMIKRKDEVRKLLLGSKEVAAISPSEMVTLEVDSGVVVFSTESEKFEVQDMAGVCKAIGLDAFFGIAKVNVTDLRKLLSENEMLAYGKKGKGTRTLKSIVAKTDGQAS